jgi:hypothetical protein
MTNTYNRVNIENRKSGKWTQSSLKTLNNWYKSLQKLFQTFQEFLNKLFFCLLVKS